MANLTQESAIKLQKILTKRFGRELTQEELEQSYDALMGFAVALVEMKTIAPQISFDIESNLLVVILPKEPLANYLFTVV
ncbi:hypothetical protein A2773_03285 [Candidatus Gottesmanbacteria bacterium RIFCSPHIGHO2_01_FULL_39_10]|uniref:Uncharacterized protein n=1 Tax=Candidatus Gottesmanbacteria bacterium RIFCSPHIGHO2_01_FULL_39_10 TaxID=1798375 RepID=A0A1F5ZMA2_9BACT|nr:MAG: hypothetical protein A2773_03285 [Candidatus Gottesmanbacteria bacterium RIFCSPHIGHO2_01_FULL_39_10]